MIIRNFASKAKVNGNGYWNCIYPLPSVLTDGFDSRKDKWALAPFLILARLQITI